MKSVITIQRLVIFFVVYTILFVVIGPKFNIWEVSRDAKDGEDIRDRVYEFVGGTRAGGLIQLCFDGVFNGADNRLFFSIREEALEKRKKNSFGSIPLYKNDFQQGCPEYGAMNIEFSILPVGYSDTARLLQENQSFLQQLPDMPHVLFYPVQYEDQISTDHFILFWRSGGKKYFHHFWIRGRTHKKIIVTKGDVFEAIFKDYATWPYVLFLLLSGAGSH